jgi:hypothetical protein
MITLGLFTGAVLLASASIAAAQTSSTSAASSNAIGANQSKCWDTATRQVQAMPGDIMMTGSSSGGTDSGSNTQGPASAEHSTRARESTGRSGSAESADGRPAEALGLPDCGG